MSFAVQNLAWRTPLSAATKLVLVRLSCFAANDGSNVRPSVSRLAKECGAGERTVQRSIRELEAAGILVMVREADAGAKRPREYRIDVDVLTKLADIEPAEDGCQDYTPTGATVTPVDDGGVPHCHPYPRHSDTPTGATVTPNPSKISASKEERDSAGSEGSPDFDLLGVAPPAPDACDQAVTDWNAMAARADLPAVRDLSDPRRRSLRQRLRECGGIGGWREVLAKVEASSFLTGRVKADFRANFDFLINAGNFIKVREGNFDLKANQPVGVNAAFTPSRQVAASIDWDAASRGADQITGISNGQ